jgi:hypothetical protein
VHEPTFVDECQGFACRAVRGRGHRLGQETVGRGSHLGGKALACRRQCLRSFNGVESAIDL